MAEKRKEPLKEGLWREAGEPDDAPHLLASRCGSCGEIFFPKKSNGICTSCQSADLEDMVLGNRGVVYTHTTVMIRPPGGYYQGSVPYAIGVVELPDGVYVDTLFTEGCGDDIQIGRAVELVIEKLCDEADRQVMTYKFRPLSSSGEA